MAKRTNTTLTLPEPRRPGSEIIFMPDCSAQFAVGKKSSSISGMYDPIIHLADLVNWPGSSLYNQQDKFTKISLGFTRCTFWEMTGFGLHMLYSDKINFDHKRGSTFETASKNMDKVRTFITPIDNRIYKIAQDIIVALGNFAYRVSTDSDLDLKSDLHAKPFAAVPDTDILSPLSHLNNLQLSGIAQELGEVRIGKQAQILEELDQKSFARGTHSGALSTLQMANLLGENWRNHAFTLLKLFRYSPTIQETLIQHHLGTIRSDAGEIGVVNQLPLDVAGYADNRAQATKFWAPFPPQEKTIIVFITNDAKFWRTRGEAIQERGIEHIDHGGCVVVCASKRVFGQWLGDLSRALSTLPEKNNLFGRLGEKYERNYTSFCLKAKEVERITGLAVDGVSLDVRKGSGHRFNGLETVANNLLDIVRNTKQGKNR